LLAFIYVYILWKYKDQIRQIKDADGDDQEELMVNHDANNDDTQSSSSLSYESLLEKEKLKGYL